MLELIQLLLGRIPEAPFIDGGNVQVLCDTAEPCRDTVNGDAGGKCHGDLEHGIVRDSAMPRRSRRNVTFPCTEGRLGHWIGGVRPVVWKASDRELQEGMVPTRHTELADQSRFSSIGRPLAIPHSPAGIDLEAHGFVSLREMS